ncbi:MAG TPA: hypothetical protein VFK88_10650 [Gallionella sp.]|nr:hypothetical protein [Gallionella sp.]
MAIHELSKEEIGAVAGGLVLPKLNLVGTLGKLLKNLIGTVGRVLKKLGL